MTKETLQQKIEERAKIKANNEYKKFVDFMQANKMSKIKFTEDGTSFDYHFYLKHQSYENLTQLENEIREIDDEIEKIKQRIFGFAVATPVVKPSDSISDMISDIQRTLDDEFESLEDNTIIRYKLILLREEMLYEED